MKRFLAIIVCLFALCDIAYAQKPRATQKQAPQKVSESAQAVRAEIKDLSKDLYDIDSQLMLTSFRNYACSIEKIIELNKKGLSAAERWEKLIPHAEYPKTQLTDETMAVQFRQRTYLSAISENERLLRVRINAGCPERAADSFTPSGFSVDACGIALSLRVSNL